MTIHIKDNPVASESNHPAYRQYPSKLFVEVTTRCNLSCSMCVKQSAGADICDGDIDPALFERLAPAFPYLEALILNGIGEPLLHPSLCAFIEQAREAMPYHSRIGFQSNGQLVTQATADALVRSGLDGICLSVDTSSLSRFAHIRTGGSLPLIEQAIATLHASAKKQGRTITTGIEIVLQRSNLQDLPATVLWAAQHGIDFILASHLMPYEKDLLSQVLFDISTDDAVQLFEHWRLRAASEGVDIRRYRNIFMKFRKSDDDMRTVDFVKDLLHDAAAKGIMLNISNLARRDTELYRQVTDIFDETDRLAKKHGITLQLPAVVPSARRQCEFVESGGMFVSWQGTVHPCYFLWHRYRTHIGSLEKLIRPHIFGSINEDDILAIWNGQQFRRFRENVLKYDFPFCYNCSFALCDYVQPEEFEHDCFVSEVPCGACLWCTGLFHCLM